jgi:hypothetical protein
MKKSVCALAAVACLAASHTVSADVIETFEDDCSVSVVIRRPYVDSAAWDGDDILLARDYTGNLCSLLQQNGGVMQGVCQTSPGQTTPFTPFIKYSTIQNSNRYFRWICGSTKERSRCPAGTKRVRFRLLGGDNEFQTQCDDTPMP